MKAVILAAGIGSRMSQFYPGIHKAMLPIRGKPIFEWNIKHLKEFGFEEIYINLHFLPDQIRDFLGSGEKFGVKIKYSYEEKMLGTAGALASFKEELTETFLVLYADIITELNFKKFLEFHKKNNADVSILVHENDHPEDSDLAELDQAGRVVKFFNKPHQRKIAETNLSSAAIYFIEPAVLKYLPKKIPADFVHDFFPILLKKSVKMYGYLSHEYSKDAGTPERYQQVLKDMEQK